MCVKEKEGESKNCVCVREREKMCITGLDTFNLTCLFEFRNKIISPIAKAA